MTSDLRQSSSTRCTFKSSNGPTSASSKVDTTLEACYANKPWQPELCQSDGLDEIMHSKERNLLSSTNLLSTKHSKPLIPLLLLFRFSLNEETRRIKNLMNKKVFCFFNSPMIISCRMLRLWLTYYLFIISDTLMTALHLLTRVQQSTPKVNVSETRARYDSGVQVWPTAYWASFTYVDKQRHQAISSN